MSYMLTQVEMEIALRGDYDSVLSATKKMERQLGEEVVKHTEVERVGCTAEGSMYRRQRETIERHSSALNVTIGEF